MITQNQEVLDRVEWLLSDCLSCTLQPLCQHLRQTLRLISILGQTADTVQAVQPFLDAIGLIVGSAKGGIQLVTPQAEALLYKYALNLQAQRLPECIQHWLESQLDQGLDKDHCSAASLPLTIERDEQRLVIRCISDPKQDQHFLLLEEQAIPGFTINTLELLGLTKREAEVLFWIAKDKSNAGIARTLNCCEGTVRKHLENLYKKLGVQTRIGAVMTALERLGLIQAEFVARSS